MVENLPVHEHEEEQEKKPSMTSNMLAILGFIILVIIVVWGIVHLVTLSEPWFSSHLQKTAPSIVITAPTDVTSGQTFNLSWNYSPTVPGTYAILYQCQSGLQMQVASANGAPSGVPCGAAFSVTSTSTVAITPDLSSASAASVPLTVVFLPSTGSTGGSQGSTSITVHPASVATTTPTPAQTQPAQTTTPAQPTTYIRPATTYATPADLSVRIISATVDAYGNATAVFDITNVGGSTSGTYYFTAQLPDASQQPYVSAVQAPLAPGAHIQNTLRFSQAVSGEFSVAVGAQDANQANNYASQWINAPVNPQPAYYRPAPTYYPTYTY